MEAPEEITEADLALLDQGFAELREFGMEIRQRDTTDVWFRDLLADLLNATLREYQHLKIGLRTSTALLAWACRNLLELNIFAQYSLASEAGARRFAGYRTDEGIEVLDSFKAWAARNDPALVTPPLDAALSDLIELKKREDAAPERILSTRYLSGEVGLFDEFANMSKVCLKLIHPTAFTVLSDDGKLRLLNPAFFRAGAGHGLEIYQAIKTHAERFGLRPKG